MSLASVAFKGVTNTVGESIGGRLDKRDESPMSLSESLRLPGSLIAFGHASQGGDRGSLPVGHDSQNASLFAALHSLLDSSYRGASAWPEYKVPTLPGKAFFTAF